MTVRSNIGSRLEEVEESLDKGILAALHGEDDASARALAGGLFTFGEDGVIQEEQVAGGVGESVGHSG